MNDALCYLSIKHWIFSEMVDMSLSSLLLNVPKTELCLTIALVSLIYIIEQTMFLSQSISLLPLSSLRGCVVSCYDLFDVRRSEPKARLIRYKVTAPRVITCPHNIVIFIVLSKKVTLKNK